MRIAYFDCFSGVSGDMVVGALLDAGVKLKDLEKELRLLGLPGFRISASRTRRCGLRATKFDVTETGRPGNRKRMAHHTQRDAAGEYPARSHDGRGDFGGSPRKMLAFVKGSRLAAPVKAAALRVIQRLVEAEARVHGCRASDVHLHELACVDTVVDVVGALCCLRLLGVERFHVSPLPVGPGTIKCSHGLLPLPAPATMELLKGLPVVPLEAGYELVTPTGAAFVSVLAAGFGPCPEMTVKAVGYGAGAMDLPGRPNVLRVVVGEQTTQGETDTVLVFETNVDNMTGEEIGYAFERLFAAGALDVYAIPLVMKKSRPGVMLGAIAPVALREAIEKVFFRETRTLGVRCMMVSRSKALRRMRTVRTLWGPIRVKDTLHGGRIAGTHAEYEDCRSAALAHDTSLRSVRVAAEEGKRQEF